MFANLVFFGYDVDCLNIQTSVRSKDFNLIKEDMKSMF